MKMEGKTKPADEIERLRQVNAEMLEALQKIAERGVPVQREEHRIARAAIARAKGDAP
jgi:hypothetical protein